MLERFWGSELRWNGTNSVKANGRACCWLGRYGNGRQTGMWWWWSLKLVKKRSEGYNSKEDDTGILLFGLGMKIPEWAECSQMRPICDSNTGCGQMWLGVDSRNWMEQEKRKVYGRWWGEDEQFSVQRKWCWESWLGVEVGLSTAFDWYISYELKFGVKCETEPLIEEWSSADKGMWSWWQIHLHTLGISAVPQEKPALPSPPAAPGLREDGE